MALDDTQVDEHIGHQTSQFFVASSLGLAYRARFKKFTLDKSTGKFPVLQLARKAAAR